MTEYGLVVKTENQTAFVRLYAVLRAANAKRVVC